MTTSRSALLLMDFQPAIVARGGSPEIFAAARTALDAARSHGIPVFFVRVAFRPGFPEVPPSNVAFTALAAAAGDALTEQSPATQIIAELAPLPSEPIVTKRRYSAFTGSDLDVLLRGQGVTHLVLAGISTSGVVLSTFRQAFDLDYGLTVLSDASGDGDPELSDLLLTRVFPRQGTVVTAAEWAAGLE